MVPSNRALATSYRLSIVTMSSSAAVWSQFYEKFQAITNHSRKRWEIRPRLLLLLIITNNESPLILWPTFPVHCDGLNSIRATQTGLLRTCHRLCCNHLDMSRWLENLKLFRDLPVSWFASAIFARGKFQRKLAYEIWGLEQTWRCGRWTGALTPLSPGATGHTTRSPARPHCPAAVYIS